MLGAGAISLFVDLFCLFVLCWLNLFLVVISFVKGDDG